MRARALQISLGLLLCSRNIVLFVFVERTITMSSGHSGDAAAMVWNGWIVSYALLLNAGGHTGFVVKQSQMSLIMGTLFALIVVYGTVRDVPAVTAVATAMLVWRFRVGLQAPSLDSSEVDKAFAQYYFVVLLASAISCVGAVACTFASYTSRSSDSTTSTFDSGQFWTAFDLAFAIMLAVGGAAGFVVKGSKMSLLMGVLFSVLISYGTFTDSATVTAVATAVLVFRFSRAIPASTVSTSHDVLFGIYYVVVLEAALASCVRAVWTASR